MKRIIAALALALAATARPRRNSRRNPSRSSCPSRRQRHRYARARRRAGRLHGDEAGRRHRQQPGASGMIAAQYVAKAPADGYTVLITTNTTHAANEHLYKRLSYDPVKDSRRSPAWARAGR